MMKEILQHCAVWYMCIDLYELHYKSNLQSKSKSITQVRFLLL